MSAPTPENELQRIDALLSYDVLDTQGESAFDELTALAADICNTPIALISLIDSKRQWFKSKVGLDVDQTPREIAFCDYAIHSSDVFEVPDATQDERFTNNPLVTDSPSIRFYAGAPLITHDGHALGTLCVIDRFPRALSNSQKKVLQSLSKAVVTQLELRQRNIELDRVNRFRSDFISYISHELRTPLNAVISFADLLDEKLKTLVHDQQVHSQLNHIRYSGQRILDTVNSVLELNKLEAGKVKVQKSAVDICSLVEQIEAITKPEADKKGVPISFTVTQSTPRVIELDESKFVQIALNLTSNAIKFSNDKNPVSVSVDYKKDTLYFAVQDQGCGIRESEQKKLFQQFERLETATQTQGTGLGLVITKQIVQLLGGNIHLNSKFGAGTLVKVHLPVNTAQSQASKPDTKESGNLRISPHTKILVVEDNDINQIVADAIFSRLGLKIDIVSSGEECVEKIKNTVYDIVFMDIRLPGMNGFEASTIVKTHCPALPIIALTADVIIDDDSYSSAGISHVLTKPIDQKALVSALNRYLKNA